MVRDPLAAVVPERAHISLDGVDLKKAGWRTIVFHKPRGVVTTSRDPEGRRTIYDVLGDAARGLVAVGRLDRATSGLLILTNDTRLADRLTDPRHAIPRVYLVTVRGEVAAADVAALERGVVAGGERLRAARAVLRKASGRESHLTIELHEGRNREIRRMFQSIGFEVTRLKRVSFGAFELGDLAPGAWRSVARDEVDRAMAPEETG